MLTLSSLALSTTTSDSDTVDKEALLGLVSQTAGLFRSSWSWASMDHVQLTILPGSDTQQEAHHIGLLVTPYLLHILVGSHGGSVGTRTDLTRATRKKIEKRVEKEELRENMRRWLVTNDVTLPQYHCACVPLHT